MSVKITTIIIIITKLQHPQTAIDISEEMIKYARTEYFDDHRLTFKIMDGGNRWQCKIYAETFDVIFSSSCLHWIPNQRYVSLKIIE